KPKPGMLRAIAEHYQIGLEGVWFVGDSKGDLEAALAIGAQPVLVKTGKGERTLEKGVPETTLIFDDLAAIARELI
ncbi:D-glycero-beta-D-manno-heptose-1,7-bisphosphate 7-phosphatase, partial [Enterococcus faecium]